MHILYFSWEENCKIDMLDTLSRIDFQCSLITAPQNNYLYNPALQDTVYQAAIDSHCDIIFSFNYLPIVAEAAERAKIPYVSWIYAPTGAYFPQPYAVLIIIFFYSTKTWFSR